MFEAIIVTFLGIAMCVGGLAITALTVIANGMQPTYNGFEGSWIVCLALIFALLGMPLAIYGWGMF